MAIELTCNIALDKSHNPRAMFVRTVMVVLRCTYDKDWELKEEVHDGVLMKIDT